MSETVENHEKCCQGNCMCAGVGPVISQMLRQFGPPEAAKQHFQTARMEMLKGVRAMLDKHIQDISKPAASPSGSKIQVD